MDYRSLSDEQQVESLRAVAGAAVDRFGLDCVGMDLVAHAYNTTFAVDVADGSRYALRLNTNSRSTNENIVAQQTWQQAIASEADVLVPLPLTTPEGQWYVEVESETYGRPLTVTAASWLAGPDLTDLDVTVARELGRAMALLHQQSENWALPADGALPRFDTPLFGDQLELHADSGLSNDDWTVLDTAREKTETAFKRLYDGARVRPVHADLHAGNVKWDGARLAVFDFDDCGFGLPVLDLAISAFYLRSGDPGPEDALRAGYAEVAPLPDVEVADFEALVAARQLLLLNTLLTSATAELRRQSARYVGVTLERLRHWLRTGRFTRGPVG